MVAGDIIFCRSDRLASRLIRAIDGGPYSHTAIAMDSETVVEATRRGVVRSNPLTDPAWEGVEWMTLSPGLSEEDTIDAVAHARWLADECYSYDWITFFFIWVFWLTRGGVMISGGTKSSICSALVADCLHAGGMRFPEAIAHFHTPRMLWRALCG